MLFRSRLLRGNYDALGVWPLAVTAYNHGRAGIQRAQAAHGNDLPTIIEDYKSPLFGYASMNFYSEFLAAVSVYNEYGKYFGDLTLDRPAGRGDVVKTASAPEAKSAQKTTKAAAETEKYKVRKGDTLSDLAARFGTSIRSLMEANRLEKSVIYAGQILLVP